MSRVSGLSTESVANLTLIMVNDNMSMHGNRANASSDRSGSKAARPRDRSIMRTNCLKCMTGRRRVITCCRHDVAFWTRPDIAVRHLAFDNLYEYYLIDVTLPITSLDHAIQSQGPAQLSGEETHSFPEPKHRHPSLDSTMSIYTHLRICQTTKHSDAPSFHIDITLFSLFEIPITCSWKRKTKSRTSSRKRQGGISRLYNKRRCRGVNGGL